MAELGESIAASFLSRRTARVLARNVRSGRFEVDLVARFGQLIVAVEVKTRTASSGLDPIEQFDRPKQEAFRQAVRGLPWSPSRLDLVTVVVGEVVTTRWIQDVC